MMIYYFTVKKYFLKLTWCLQNFLTMEFYRKICNNYYWSNFYDSRHSFFKQTVILIVSFVSMMFFSFFYLPTDPANLKKASLIIKSVRFITAFRTVLGNFFRSGSARKIKSFYTSAFTDELSCISGKPSALNPVLLI